MESPETVVAAVWQGAAAPRDIAANVATVARVATAAASRGVHLCVFPELFLSGYAIGTPAMRGAAVGPMDARLGPIAAAAKAGGVAIAVGYPEAGSGDKIYNSCAVWDAKGTLARSYRKVNLWGPWEAATFAPGDPSELRAFDLTLRAGTSLRVGVLVCYDLEFPEPSRCLALDGAQVLIAPTALTEGEVGMVTPFCVVPTRANENHVFVLYANLEGSVETGDGPPYCGSSAIVGPNGRELARDPRRSGAARGAATPSTPGADDSSGSAGTGGGCLLVAPLLVGGAEHVISRARNPYLTEVAERLDGGFYPQIGGRWRRARY
mmetsp:Transcript_25037/g.75467  ORF Transcript_25037/g.75467 Transcript_25037/m.75467 type:complete len:322 (-) Transcript_25037:48-1013(-)